MKTKFVSTRERKVVRAGTQTVVSNDEVRVRPWWLVHVVHANFAESKDPSVSHGTHNHTIKYTNKI